MKRQRDATWPKGSIVCQFILCPDALSPRGSVMIIIIIIIKLTVSGARAVGGVCWKSAFIEEDIVWISLPLIGRMSRIYTAEQ
jgi:hypothetical protein